MMSGLAADGVDYIPGCNDSQQVGVASGFFMLFFQKPFLLGLIWNKMITAIQNGAVGFAFYQILI